MWRFDWYSSVSQFTNIYKIDVNECTLGTHNCDTNADCANTLGSFTCSCKSGYSGNGLNCTGKMIFSFTHLNSGENNNNNRY